MVSEVSLHMKSVNAYTALVQLVESVKIGHGTIYRDIVCRLMTIVSADVIALVLIGSTVLTFFVAGALLYVGVMKLCQLAHSTNVQPTKNIASYPFTFAPVPSLPLPSKLQLKSIAAAQQKPLRPESRRIVYPDREALEKKKKELEREKEKLLNWLQDQDPQDVPYQMSKDLGERDKHLKAEIEAIQLQLSEYMVH